MTCLRRSTVMRTYMGNSFRTGKQLSLGALGLFSVSFKTFHYGSKFGQQRSMFSSFGHGWTYAYSWRQ